MIRIIILKILKDIKRGLFFTKTHTADGIGIWLLNIERIISFEQKKNDYPMNINITCTWYN